MHGRARVHARAWVLSVRSMKWAQGEPERCREFTVAGEDRREAASGRRIGQRGQARVRPGSGPGQAWVRRERLC